MKKTFSRRAFLTGVGGVTLALPWLESLGRPAWAANDGGPPRYAFFMRNGNGVQQADGGEPERFWPHETGALTSALMSGRDADRAVSELSDYADRLILVKGTRFPFSPTTCGHAQGGNQVLTAARPNDAEDHRTLATGESIDNLIARSFSNNGGEPLSLYTGPRRGYLEEVLSYRGSEDLRAGEDDPWNAYQRMVGSTDGNLDRHLENRRLSVNDLVRDQMTGLMARELSTRDRQRLDLHFEAIRDFELNSCALSADLEQEMATLAGQGTLNDNRVRVSQLHLELVALAFSCDFARAATLQIGDGNDSTEYMIGGTRYPSHHFISHRIMSDGDAGDPIPNADVLHHDIDRLQAQIFKHLLDRLTEFGILDDTVAVWTNDLGAGVSHRYSDVPWVMAGSAGGNLATGQFIDAGDVGHNLLLNTIGNAVGVRKEDGSPLDDFGDSSLPTGRLSQIES